VQLHRARHEIHARGAELYLVGNGAPHFARAFREDHGIETPIFTDPTLETYRALEFRRSVIHTITLRVARNALRALRGGHLQGRTKGDAWQLGGVLLVRPGGEVAYRYASSTAGDHPPVDAVLNALGPATPDAAGAAR
jgi:hypothetical protein